MTVNDRCFPFGSVRFKVCFLYSSSYYFIFLFVFWRIFAYLVFQIFLFACFFFSLYQNCFSSSTHFASRSAVFFSCLFFSSFSIFYLHLSLRFCWICCIFFCCIYIFSLSTTVFHLSITINIFLSTFKSNYLFFILLIFQLLFAYLLFSGISPDYRVPPLPIRHRKTAISSNYVILHPQKRTYFHSGSSKLKYIW